MIPLIYLLMVTDFLAHKAIGAMKPAVYAPGVSSGSYVVAALITASIVGLVLSLVGRGYSARSGE